MKLAVLPPWLRESPAQHAQSLRQHAKLRQKALDMEMTACDHVLARSANKDGGTNHMKFKDIPKEIVQVGAIKAKGPVRLTSLADGSVLKVVALTTEAFHKRGDAEDTNAGTRFLISTKGGDTFVVSPANTKQIEAGMAYAAANGKTEEDKRELEITLASVTTGKGDKTLTRRCLA